MHMCVCVGGAWHGGHLSGDASLGHVAINSNERHGKNSTLMNPFCITTII